MGRPAVHPGPRPVRRHPPEGPRAQRHHRRGARGRSGREASASGQRHRRRAGRDGHGRAAGLSPPAAAAGRRRAHAERDSDCLPRLRRAVPRGPPAPSPACAAAPCPALQGGRARRPHLRPRPHRGGRRRAVRGVPRARPRRRCRQAQTESLRAGPAQPLLAEGQGGQVRRLRGHRVDGCKTLRRAGGRFLRGRPPSSVRNRRRRLRRRGGAVAA